MAQVPFQMPLQDTPNTPKFSGKTLSELPQYLEDIDLLGDAAVLDKAQKIKATIHYAALDEAEVWQTLPEATANPADWADFVAATKKLYPRCEGANRYCRTDIQYLIGDYCMKVMHSQDDLGEYTRKFTKFTVILIANQKLSEMECDIMFLAGFPMPLQDRVHHRLAIVKLDVHLDDPHLMDDVIAVVKFLTGSTFRSTIPPIANACLRDSVEYAMSLQQSGQQPAQQPVQQSAKQSIQQPATTSALASSGFTRDLPPHLTTGLLCSAFPKTPTILDIDLSAFLTMAMSTTNYPPMPIVKDVDFQPYIAQAWVVL